MNYRYPFTPYPKGWYRIVPKANRAYAFGRALQLRQTGHGELKLCDENNPQREFPLVKKNNYLFAFYDRQNQAPYFEVPEVPEFTDDQWQRPFHLSWKIRIHIQEVAENALDLSHFCKVHTYEEVPLLSGFETKAHQFSLTMHSRRRYYCFMSKVSMDITYHGMGVVVSGSTSACGATLKVLLTTTPLDEQHVIIHMEVALKKSWNPLMNYSLKKVMQKEVYHEFSRDIPVWEAKMYRSKPLLCVNEANIVRVRKWAQQFYD